MPRGALPGQGGWKMSAEKRDLIRKVPLFHDFSDSDCDAMLHVLKARRFTAGEHVFEQGASGDTMVILIDGRLRVETLDGQGNRQELGAIGPGEIVGESAVLDPAKRSASVVAASDAVVYELNRVGLLSLRTAAPYAATTITTQIISEVTKRLRGTNGRIDLLLNPNASAPRKRPLAGAVLPNAEAETGSMFSRLWSRLTGA